MPRNVEVKARVDSLEALRIRIAALVSGPGELIEQRDTFFDLLAERATR